MKPHGILFRPEMILALLNTKPDVWPAEPIDPANPFKWQTRRGMKPQPTDDTAASGHWYWKDQAFDSHRWPDVEIIAPHPVGQIVYAKETLCRSGANVQFQADFSECRIGLWPWSLTKDRNPSVHMPMKAARLWFVVKRVRVERVNAISEADCIAEGIRVGANLGEPSARDVYSELFDSINGKGAFARGDWCWVYDLARTSKPEVI